MAEALGVWLVAILATFVVFLLGLVLMKVIGLLD